MVLGDLWCWELNEGSTVLSTCLTVLNIFVWGLHLVVLRVLTLALLLVGLGYHMGWPHARPMPLPTVLALPPHCIFLLLFSVHFKDEPLSCH